jgi:hypothetical protein
MLAAMGGTAEIRIRSILLLAFPVWAKSKTTDCSAAFLRSLIPATMILMMMALTAILGGSRFWLARSTH